MKRFTSSEISVLVMVLALEGIGLYALFHARILLAAILLASAKVIALLLLAFIRLRRNRENQLHVNAMVAVARHKGKKS